MKNESESTSKRAKPLEIEIPKAVQKELKGLPELIRDQFLVNIEMVSLGMTPDLTMEHLTAAGRGVIELKINGSPAHRLVYTTKLRGKLVVLAARAKTTNGSDNPLIDVARSRLKRYGGK